MGWFGWRDHDTRGVLIAGREYNFAGLTPAQVIALCDAIDAIAERTGIPIVAVPIDADLTDESGMPDDDTALCNAFVGVLIAEGGTYEPLAVTREAMLQAMEQARAIPPEVWADITAAYHDEGGAEWIEEDILVRLGCTGSLPEAKLAFGVLGQENAGLRGAFIRGKAPDRTPHSIGVHGVLVDACHYADSPALPIDVADEAHAARVAQLPNGAYYLIARYD